MENAEYVRQPNLKGLYQENLANLPLWGIRQEAIEQISEAASCQTEVRGAEVFRSENGEEFTVWHTCKSRCCPTCGSYRSMLWVADICERVPDIPFTSVVFTMRSHLWEVFRRNRCLLAALPGIGARVVQDWAREQYGAEVLIVVVQHTFGSAFNFNVHLHLIASNVGLALADSRLVEGIQYSAEEITRAWRRDLIAFLLKEAQEGWLQSDLEPDELLMSITKEANAEDWVRLVRKVRSVHQYLRYMGRYLRRQPITNNRLLPSVPGTVRYKYWRKLRKHEPTLPGDVITRFGTRKRIDSKSLTVREFFEMLADQVPELYSHGPRYFGLLAPRSTVRYRCFLRLVGKQPVSHGRPRHGWAYWLRKRFGVNRLRDSHGKPMKWARSIAPLRRKRSGR